MEAVSALEGFSSGGALADAWLPIGRTLLPVAELSSDKNRREIK
jgi:hypothetical protein